jgi:CxxC-x17-CxxC domain-containing protein
MQNESVNYTDIPLLLNKIHQRLTSLESKVDMLVGRGAPARAAEPKPLPVPVQRPPVQVNPGNAGRQDHGNREKKRMMYKIVCADCKKESEIPFRPKGDRPVYCHDCFARRKAGNSLRAGVGSKPAEISSAHANHIDEKQVGGEEKIVAKREPVKKKRVAAKKKVKALTASKKKRTR